MAGTVMTLLLVASSASAKADASSCGGLTLVHETTELVYPPIARAAHIEGNVILLATFDRNGAVARTKKVLGAEMLEYAATAYVKGWQANTYSGPRECAIVVTFRLIGLTAECENDVIAAIPLIQRPDLQHSILTVSNSCVMITRDPASKKIHRFYLW